MRRRRKLKPYKISRGSLEEQKLREDNRIETQRALLFILPLVMLAILAVGVFFGYKAYVRSLEGTPPADYAQGATEAAPGDPMLLRTVNSAHPLPEDYVPTLVERYGVQLSPDMAGMLDRMLSDASDAGFALTVKEGYISFKEQSDRYETAVADYRKSSKASLVKAEAQVKRTIPRAGESEQQTGLLIYLDAEGDGDFADSDAFAWLLDHSVSYGFILRYPDQENVGGLSFSPHLFRYVGEDHAYYIRAYNMTFDEYIAYLDLQ